MSARYFLYFMLFGFIFLLSREYSHTQPKEKTGATALPSLLGLPSETYHMAISSDNQKIIDLGQKLFFDKRLSRDNTIACAGCHKPLEAFTDYSGATSSGFQGKRNRRNTPSLLNVFLYERLHQDGRATELETQYLLPLTDHNEMASRSVGYVIKKLQWISEYPKLFQETFGREISTDTVGRALAAYQRTLVSANSRFDRWFFGQENTALSAQEKAGFALFRGKGECASCHVINEKHALFTDQAFHDIGHGWKQNHHKPEHKQDRGRYEVTHDKRDLWRYRTPTLRNIAITAPYMHDGAFKTLEEVVTFYNKGGEPHEGQDHRIRKLGLTVNEITALVAFLKTLTGDKVNHPPKLLKRQ